MAGWRATRARASRGLRFVVAAVEASSRRLLSAKEAKAMSMSVVDDACC
jgi:hypothetical protein